MKQVTLSIALTITFLTNQSFVTPSPQKTSFKETVILYAGTPISFKLCENKNSDELEVGNTILVMTDDVVVADGQPVVRKGERAEGTITAIRRQNHCANCADKRQRIEVSVDRVKAVDGQYIPLFGAPMTVSSKCPTCPVELNQTMRLDANVESNVVIRIR